MNAYEVLLWFVIIFEYYVLSYAIIKDNKKTVVITLLCCPAFYLLVYKSTQFWIIDTNKYLDRFIDLSKVSEIFPSCLVTFSFSLMLVGTFNLLISFLAGKRIEMSLIRAEKLAMMFHLLVGVLITFLIIWVVWNYFITEDAKTNMKYRLVYLVEMSYIIFLLPIYVLETKIFNYDSLACLGGVLGLFLCLAGVKHKNEKLLIWAVVISTLASMEKVMASPILEMSIVIFAVFHAMRKTGTLSTLRSVLKYTLVGYAIYVAVDVAVHLYTSVFLLNGEAITYNAETIFYAINDPIFRILAGAGLDGGNQTGITFVVFFILTTTGIILCYFIHILQKEKIMLVIKKMLPYYNAVLLSVIIIGGIYATFCVKLKIYPYIEFLAGEYKGVIGFDDWKYNYGGTTKWMQSLFLTLDSWGQILNSITTVHLLLLVFFVIEVFLKKIRIESDDDFWLQCVVGGTSTLVVVYAIVGIPPDAKYKSLYVIGLFISVLCCAMKRVTFYKKEMILTCILICLMWTELYVYRPNELVFSPIWNIKSEQEKKYPVKGEIRAGEAMSWGFHNMIAGEKIQSWAENNGIPYEHIYMYSDYYSKWLENPGINIRTIESSEMIKDFGEKDFYVLSRFALFRKDIPKYIYEEEPFETVEYRGEIVAWIYRGVQLEKYY